MIFYKISLAWKFFIISFSLKTTRNNHTSPHIGPVKKKFSTKPSYLSIANNKMVQVGQHSKIIILVYKHIKYMYISYRQMHRGLCSNSKLKPINVQFPKEKSLHRIGTISFQRFHSRLYVNSRLHFMLCFWRPFENEKNNTNKNKTCFCLLLKCFWNLCKKYCLSWSTAVLSKKLFIVLLLSLVKITIQWNINFILNYIENLAGEAESDMTGSKTKKNIWILYLHVSDNTIFAIT